MSNALLVTGATGKQGGAVINALLEAPEASSYTIFALTRSPDSAAAKSLLSKAPEQIKLIKGDLKDSPAIFTAIEAPVKGVFCVSIPALGPGSDSESEEANANALVDAAVAQGVEHFVFTSVDRHGSDSDNTDTSVPHFVRKAKIERHLKEKCQGTKTRWTILRPTAFMDNITPGFAGKIFPTAWKVGLKPTTKLQLISPKDIGFFGAQALLRPEEFSGRAISLAGDELTFDEANTIFKAKVGTDIPTTFGFVGSGLIWALKDVGLMFRFFEDVGYAADIAALRKEHPGLLSFEHWLQTTDFMHKESG